jgi:hypothetical protein
MFLTLSNRTFTTEHLDCRSQSSCLDNVQVMPGLSDYR